MYKCNTLHVTDTQNEIDRHNCTSIIALSMAIVV